MKKRKGYLAKKAKINAEVQQNHDTADRAQSNHPNSTNQTRPTYSDKVGGSEFDASADATLDPKTPGTPFEVNKSTLANNKWEFRKFVTKSQIKTASACVSLIKSSTLAIKNMQLNLYKRILKIIY